MTERVFDDDNIPLQSVEEAESPPPAYENPQIISGGCKDINFAIAFWIHAVGVIIVAIVFGIPALLNNNSKLGSVDSFKGISLLFKITPFHYALGAAIITVVLAWIIAFVILQRFAAQMIKCLFIITIVFQGIVTLITLISLLWQLCIAMCVFLFLTIMHFFCVRKRIPFAEAHLQVGCVALRSHPSLIFVALSMLVVQFFWLILYLIMVKGIKYAMSDRILVSNINMIETTTISLIHVTNSWSDQEQYRTTERLGWFQDDFIDPTLGWISLIIYFVGLYPLVWGILTFRYIVYFITSCAVGHWWFPGDISRQYTMRTSIKRAFTTNFGTITLGSLLVAIIKTLRFMVGNDNRKKNIVSAIIGCYASCILNIIEGLIGYFNRWAFVYAALNGQKFTDAGQSFINLAKQRGLTMIINDDLVGNILLIISVAVGLVTAAVGSVIYYILIPDSPSQSQAVYSVGFIYFLIGVAMSSIMTSVLSSCVRTVFVCFTLNPAILAVTHPEHLQNLIEAWHQFHPNEFISSGYANHLPKPTSVENV